MPSEGPEDQVPGGRSNGKGDLGQHGHHPSPDHRRMCLLLDVGGKQREADGAIGELLGSAFSSNVGLVRGPSGLGESHVPRAEPKTYGFHVRNTCRQVLVHELERCCEELPHDTRELVTRQPQAAAQKAKTSSSSWARRYSSNTVRTIQLLTRAIMWSEQYMITVLQEVMLAKSRQAVK